MKFLIYYHDSWFTVQKFKNESVWAKGQEYREPPQQLRKREKGRGRGREEEQERERE